MGDFGPAYMHTQQARPMVCAECGARLLLPRSASCTHCGTALRSAANAASSWGSGEEFGSLPDGASGTEALEAMVPALLQRIVPAELIRDLVEAAGGANINAPVDEVVMDELPTVKIEPHVLLRVARHQPARVTAACAAEARAAACVAGSARTSEAGSAAGGAYGGAIEAGAGTSDAAGEGGFGGEGSLELRGTASSFGVHFSDLPDGVTGQLLLADPLDAACDLLNSAEARGKVSRPARPGGVAQVAPFRAPCPDRTQRTAFGARLSAVDRRLQLATEWLVGGRLAAGWRHSRRAASAR